MSDVQDVLNQIADDIERVGHYPYAGEGLYDPDTCCLVANPTLKGMDNLGPVKREYTEEMARRTGVGIDPEKPWRTTSLLMNWNDTHTTAEALAMLRGQA